jgi:hypothetical protein
MDEERSLRCPRPSGRLAFLTAALLLSGGGDLPAQKAPAAPKPSPAAAGASSLAGVARVGPVIVTTPALTLTGLSFAMSTDPIAVTGLATSVTTPGLAMTGQALAVSTEPLAVTGTASGTPPATTGKAPSR